MHAWCMSREGLAGGLEQQLIFVVVDGHLCFMCILAMMLRADENVFHMLVL